MNAVWSAAQVRRRCPLLVEYMWQLRPTVFLTDLPSDRVQVGNGAGEGPGGGMRITATTEEP